MEAALWRAKGGTRQLPEAQRLLLAVLVPAGAALIQLLLWRPLISPLVWFLFYPAVFAVSWIGGRIPGLVATGCSALIAWVLFVPPGGVLVKGNSRIAVSALVFTLMGVAFSEVNERLRRTTRRLEAAHTQVEGLLEQTVELNRVRSEFFANVSHELRTPLTLILGPLHRILTEPRSAELDREQLTVVERNAQVLLGLVEELLEGASLESGTARTDLTSTDLAALVRQTTGQFAEAARLRAITLNVLVEPVVVELDRARISRALTNLIGNAFKFTPDGGQVRVSLNQQGGLAVLEVADSGPGIPSAEREVVFQRFRQVNGGPTRKQGGVGLGLAIVRDIAALHGGAVQIEDAPEGGALLRLTLPIMAAREPLPREEPSAPGAATPATPSVAPPGAAPSPAATATPSAEPQTHEGRRRQASRGSVLVVEDNVDLNSFLCQELGRSFEVIPALDGGGAVSLAMEHRPTVIVTDLMMPGFSGEELLRTVRGEPELADTPVVVLTARDDRALMLQLLREGANDYVVKPFSIEELQARLQNLVGCRLGDLERQRAQTRAESLLQAAPDATIVVDGRGVILSANRQAEAMFGYPLSELLGQSVGMLLAPEDRPAHPGLREGFMRAPHRRTMGSGMELSACRKDGSPLPVDVSLSPIHSQEGTLVIAAVRDVSAQRAAQDQLRHLALHDVLTGLPNRVLLIEHLTHKIAELERARGCVAVLFVDMDRFKRINDQHGHAVGDGVLKEVGGRLQTCLRAHDIVARLSGDEFAIACGLLTDDTEALALAERIEAALQEPVSIADLKVPVSAIVGVAIARAPDVTAGDLLRHADTAMYQAKDRGRSRIQVFDEALGRLAVQRARAEVLIRQGLEHDRLRLLYQPVVDLRTRQLAGAEALLRIQDDNGGLVTPDVFLAVAEDSGLIVPLGRWVIRQACTQLATWQAGGWAGHLWINVSAQQLRGGDLPPLVHAALRDSGAPAHKLGLEITETTFMEATPDVLAQLDELKRSGITLAIDDFGTGWSSLSYLRNLPADTVKIDRSFTQALGSHADTAIVSAIVRLAHALDRSVVIEGVETPQQLAHAVDAGCDLVQGFLFARPMEAADLVGFDPTIRWPEDGQAPPDTSPGASTA